ncbi:DUF6445 family protein [Sphingomonas bacterium]|uniref:DUF6445 family protein n=1 Tax=Sphingomonas bacterium TaxID=1895847 RepID=UPI0026116948|nr:DUF6445 family protein [Sphingomonas bacterium]MDB5679490.1 hypothetical protein [Sphingomonas bacterium]
MTPELRHIGDAQIPVVVIDDVTGAPGAAVALAAAMAPFPPSAGNYYPGLRQPIAPDARANAYVEHLLEISAPFIGGAFDADGFDLIEASFSIVTTPPGSLDPAQRAPHFDSTDPDHLAVMHYLTDTPGTAFFRQRATGIERVDARNQGTFVDHAKRAAATMAGYVQGSNAHYEEIGRIEGRRDRLAIYPGALLHSGIIPPDAILDSDPRAGRLTTNIFVRLRRD